MEYTYYCRVCGSYSTNGKCPCCGMELAHEESSEAQEE
jgi:hypothetical protein